MKGDKFTMLEALEVQEQDLARWKRVLKPEMYSRLALWAERPNNEVDSPYHIRRGDALYEFVANHLMRPIEDPTPQKEQVKE